MRGAPVGCAMLLAALVLGIGIGLLIPRPTASRAPSRPAITPVTVMRDVAAAIADPATPPVPTAAARVQPDPVPVVVPKATQRPRNGLSGQASWFGAPTGTAAAGRSLRAFLGRGWRGQTVQACGPAGCARVRLTDWMGNPRRVLDLNTAAFTAICGPLSRGVCDVRVER